jgi:CheY-like chemotaxis protein
MQALAVLDDFVPDAAFLDIGLPDIDGYELARRLRADARSKDARLIALTGYGRDPDQEHAMAVGFDVHLAKPAEIDAMLRALERAA